MDARRKVVLYGDSVVLAGMGATLERYPRLEVISLAVPPATTPRQLDDLCPSVVVLDLGMVKTDFVFALLSDHPDLLLIGLDPGGDRLLVLSGQHARGLATEDLVRLIESCAGLPEGNHPEEKKR